MEHLGILCYVLDQAGQDAENGSEASNERGQS